MAEILIPILIVGIIGLIAGVGLSLASKFMAVAVDETEEKLLEALPGANCGACGYSGCEGYARAIANGEAAPDKCAPGGAVAAAAIAEILGVAVEIGEPQVAFIACAGCPEKTAEAYEYSGLKSCMAASLVHKGPLECKFGCIGFGDCAAACPFDAISISNGRPEIDTAKCTACGKCAAACPKALISIIPADRKIKVVCSNGKKGPEVAKGCKASCIASGLCEKACESEAIKVKGNLAVIDYSKCTACGKCAAACKRGVISI